MQPLAALVPLNPRRDGACPVLGAPPNYGRARIRNDEWKILGRRFRDSYQGIASAMPQALEIRSSFSSLQKNSVCSCFWVTQRFTAAITNLFSAPALAAEVTLRRGKHFFRNLLGVGRRNHFVPYRREAIWPFASWTVIVCPVATFESLSTCPLGQSISTVSALVFDPMPNVSTSSLCER
jgi:hypothetical protein